LGLEEILKNICASERNLKERWPRREILKNTGASKRNSEEHLGLGEKFEGYVGLGEKF
jgi:hypothetical protein